MQEVQKMKYKLALETCSGPDIHINSRYKHEQILDQTRGSGTWGSGVLV